MTSQVETPIRVVVTKDVEAVADTTDLAIMDAHQFEESSIARVHLAPTTEVQ